MRPDLPPALCRIVHKMLAKDPKERYADARELLRDLRSLEIEGLSGDWPVELDERNTVEAAALGQTTFDGTRRLGTLMQTQALAIRGERRWRRWFRAGDRGGVSRRRRRHAGAQAVRLERRRRRDGRG